MCVCVCVCMCVCVCVLNREVVEGVLLIYLCDWMCFHFVCCCEACSVVVEAVWEGWRLGEM